MDRITLANSLKSERAKLELKTKDVAKAIDVKPPVITYIEKTADENSRFKYLRYLRSQGVDLNELFK